MFIVYLFTIILYYTNCHLINKIISIILLLLLYNLLFLIHHHSQLIQHKLYVL